MARPEVHKVRLPDGLNFEDVIEKACHRHCIVAWEAHTLIGRTSSRFPPPFPPHSLRRHLRCLSHYIALSPATGVCTV